MNDDSQKIRITAADLDGVAVPAPQIPGVAPVFGGSGGDWGSVGGQSGAFGATGQVGGASSFFLKAWVYLALSGAAGAFFGWGICEPFYDDHGSGHSLAHFFLLPVVVAAICLGFAIAESIAERSVEKGLIRGVLALVVGLLLGVVFSFVANFLYRLAMVAVMEAVGKYDQSNPVFWVVRAAAWAVFGVTGGVVYGIAGLSWKKCFYGVLGGILGAGIGGVVFDPICLVTNGGELSRCVGFMIFGGSTGIAIGLVESALKNRWLYVSGGPLAGKQFVLYKPVTQIGSQQSNDIYLFKDPTIAPTHARIELRGNQAVLTAAGATLVSGQPVTQRTLRSGDTIQIGRYVFQYHEKRATA